jgi:bifunctional non-homologous end joining protein LigD
MVRARGGRFARVSQRARDGGDATVTSRGRSLEQPDLFTHALGTQAPMPRRIEPCKPTLVDKAPSGDQWLHEIKFDGYRLMTFPVDGTVRLDTRNGLDWTRYFPGIAEALAALPLESAIIDGEAVVLDERGVPDFGALQAALGGRAATRSADEAVLVAFDLL